GGTGIVVNVVGFRLEEGKDDTITAEEFQKAIEAPPVSGKFYNIQKTEELAGALEAAMVRKLRYFVTRDGIPLPGMRAEGLDVSQKGDKRQWSPILMPRQSYTARVRIGKSIERNINIDGGDRLLLNLIPRRTGFAFERDLYGLTNATFGANKVRSVEESNW